MAEELEVMEQDEEVDEQELDEQDDHEVDVTGLSEEDIDKILEGKTDEESALEKDVKTEDEDDAAAAKKAEDEAKAEPTLEELRDKVKSLEEENAKKTKMVEQQEQFIQGRNNEIGGLRKQLAAIQTTQKYSGDQIKNMAATDPQLAEQALAANIEVDNQRQALEAQIATAETEQAVRGYHPDIDALLPDIAAIIDEDMPGQNYGRSFMVNPYSWDAAVLHNLAHRVKQKQQIATLTAKVELLERENKQAVKDAIAKINAAAKKRRGIGGGSGGAATDSDGIPVNIDVTKLSDADLEKLYETGKL